MVSLAIMGLFSAVLVQCCMPLGQAAGHCMPEGAAEIPKAACCLVPDAVPQGELETRSASQVVTKVLWIEQPGTFAPVLTVSPHILYRITPPGDKPRSFQTCVLLI